MHPARSIVFFTVTSGAGYGLLVLLGLAAAGGWLSPTSGETLAELGLAFAMISAGLLASTAHLGHPERAWRALTQWRSSWLSREGVASLLTFVPAIAFGLSTYLGVTRWTSIFGVAMAVLAAVTVACTAMIYQSLKPIHQWNNQFVLPIYLLFALALGALWLTAVGRLWGMAAQPMLSIAIATVAMTAMLKTLYWRFIDATASPVGAGSATGLGRFGAVRLFEAPHTGSNYLMKEMGFQVARRYARVLRRLVVVVGFVAPLIFLVVAAAAHSTAATWLAVLAAVAGTAGAFVERWLFFAEAKHTVTLYYGASKV